MEVIPSKSTDNKERVSIENSADKKRHQKKKNCRQAIFIPCDLHYDILRCLPAKSLVRFRCVCKKWNSILSKRRLILSCWQSFQSINYEDSNVEAKELRFPLENRSSFKVLGSCNGLLCMAIKSETMIICNPFGREYKNLPLPYGYNASSDHFGFGYDHSTDDYKIVRFPRRLPFMLLNVGIYSLKANSWEDMTDNFLNTWSSYEGRLNRKAGLHRISGSAGTHVNCVLYWQVISPSSYDAYYKTIILFNLIEGKFSSLLAPEGVQNPDTKSELGVFGGCLSMVHYNVEGSEHIDIWTLNSKEAEQKTEWMKVMTIPPMEEPPYGEQWALAPVCLMKDEQVLLVGKRKAAHKLFSRTFFRGKKRFYLFDPEQRTFRALKIRGMKSFNDVILHTETPI